MQGEGKLRGLAATQAGHISSAQARAVGLSSTEYARLPSTGRWVELTPRVSSLVGAPPVRGERFFAAILDQGGDAAVAGEGAAWWWGVAGFSPRHPSVVTTSRTRHTTDLADVRRIRWLPDRWVTVLNGLRVVRPELMLLQLCADLHPLRAARALDNAWRERLVSGASIDELLGDVGRQGRNGVTVLRELRAQREGDYVPPASNLERRATEVLAGLGLDLIRQVDSGGHDRWDGRVDLRDRVLPLVVEVQSEKYHSALLDREADERRRQQFEEDGYEFVEVTDDELFTARDLVRDRVRAALGTLRSRRLVG